MGFKDDMGKTGGRRLADCLEKDKKIVYFKFHFGHQTTEPVSFQPRPSGKAVVASIA